MIKALIIAILQLMAEKAMSQPGCDLVKVAEDYARARWPVDLTTGRRVVKSLEGSVWKVRFTLPVDTFGYVPEIGIDQRTCRVISAILWQ
jgi:hypothetical protein